MYTYETLIESYYSEWNLGLHDDWNYADMVYCARDRNPLHALVLLVSTYDSQVYNGGHQQYLDNGYADGNNGIFLDHPTTDMHDLMISLFNQLGLSSDKRFTAAITTMHMFKVDNELICDECDGKGYIVYCDEDKEDEFGDCEEECAACDGTGYINGPAINEELADNLDNFYYAICDQFMINFKDEITKRLQEDIS